MLLEEQQQTTAVDRFAQFHADETEPLLRPQYRELIPLSEPGPGEQYAFEVDLDVCSGCKSCVAACHNLNGLEEKETWRDVGLLSGGSTEQPFLQHVTTACHHCIEPACLLGCPVMAYEKDPVTGVVRHLDDQCIGCQYCVLKCPYDVPRYSDEKGIVRKCDMCHDRLAVGEAPACVQSCPNQAIRITTVSTEAIVEDCESSQFLPTAPEPGYTLPTTVYKTERSMPRNALPADYYTPRREHSHWALVIMLVLTQMSAGAFVVGQALLMGPWASEAAQSEVRPAHVIAAMLLGNLGLVAAIFHLGRPQYAFRALLGLRTSWLSREILAFNIFAGLAAAYAAAVWFASSSAFASKSADTLGALAAASGVVAVACSIMIYVDTQRPYWTGARTSIKFLLTMLVLGLPVLLAISLAACIWSETITPQLIMEDYGYLLCKVLMIAVGAKLLYELSVFANLVQKNLTPMRRTAMLLADEFGRATYVRFAVGVVGGLLLPLLLLSYRGVAAENWLSSWGLGTIVTLSFGMLLVGEIIERYLFFAASVAPKMPGAAAK
ncbi:MAG: DmsC/YnfH family molybdoenzyme membrane anchor subunit [Planctomycetota bacterium]